MVFLESHLNIWNVPQDLSILAPQHGLSYELFIQLRALWRVLVGFLFLFSSFQASWSLTLHTYSLVFGQRLKETPLQTPKLFPAELAPL